MTGASAGDAFSLLGRFLSRDEYYLASSQSYGDRGSEALNDSLELFLSRPELGFVWLAYADDQPVGICVVCFAISTSVGGIVAKLDDFSVTDGRQGQGIGSALLSQLKEELRRLGVLRVDTSVHLQNTRARRFYERHGFLSLDEERLACLI